MPNYKLLIEYDGTDFYGWQYQPKLRTVQGELESAISTLTKEKISLLCAGRTDRGVHARGQVANFISPLDLDPALFRHSLNGITGKDIVVKEVTIAPDAFHARFDAKQRQYVYVLSLQPLAIGRQYAFYCKHQLDIEAMKQAADFLYGEHHFEAFAQKSPNEKHYLSKIDFIEWQQKDHQLAFRIRANRFLHNMVRNIVGTLIQVGRGKLTPEEFKNILDSRERKHLRFKAPPHGLFLEKVFY